MLYGLVNSMKMQAEKSRIVFLIMFLQNKNCYLLSHRFPNQGDLQRHLHFPCIETGLPYKHGRLKYGLSKTLTNLKNIKDHG